MHEKIDRFVVRRLSLTTDYLGWGELNWVQCSWIVCEPIYVLYKIRINIWARRYLVQVNWKHLIVANSWRCIDIGPSQMPQNCLILAILYFFRMCPIRENSTLIRFIEDLWEPLCQIVESLFAQTVYKDSLYLFNKESFRMEISF